METKEKSIFFPPGGILIWIIIYVELCTFGMAIGALTYFASFQRELYHLSSLELNKTIGIINTLFLLTSGFLLAKGVQHFKKKNISATLKFYTGAMMCGVSFLILKLVEYASKLDASLTMDYNDFFTFYWLLTGFHFIHVLVGLVILLFIRIEIKRKQQSASLDDIEAGASFWHMCDLIWLLIFPVLYLLL